MNRLFGVNLASLSPQPWENILQLQGLETCCCHRKWLRKLPCRLFVDKLTLMSVWLYLGLKTFESVRFCCTVTLIHWSSCTFLLGLSGFLKTTHIYAGVRVKPGKVGLSGITSGNITRTRQDVSFGTGTEVGRPEMMFHRLTHIEKGPLKLLIASVLGWCSGILFSL